MDCTGARDLTGGIKLAIASYSFLIVIQIGAFLLTDILILLAQSLDRVSDILISLFFLVSVYVSRRPADPQHAFGHARVQNVVALIASTVLIFFISLETFREAIPRLLNPASVEVSDAGIALAISLLSMAVIAAPSIMLLKSKEPGTSRAQLLNLLLDEFASGVAVVGAVLLSLGYPLADPIGSMMVAGAIVLTGVVLLKENAAILIGSSPDGDFRKRLVEAALSVEGVKGVHDLRAEYVGPDTIHADLHIEIPPETRIADADRIAQQVRKSISESTGCRYCEVHSDPYMPED